MKADYAYWLRCVKCHRVDVSDKTRVGTAIVMRCPDCCKPGNHYATMCRDCCPTGHRTRFNDKEVNTMTKVG